MRINTVRKNIVECIGFIKNTAGIEIAKKFIINNIDRTIELKEKKEYTFVKFGTYGQKGYYKPCIDIITDTYIKETNDFIILKNHRINKNNVKCVVYR